MSQPRQLGELLEEWRQASEAEGEAIEMGHWDKVARCQELKSRLREIITASGEATPEIIHQEQVQRTVRDLVQLEMRNSCRIDERRRKLSLDESRLRTVPGNLRKVRSAYGAGHPTAIWNSYS